jgi:hypothetical protein
MSWIVYLMGAAGFDSVRDFPEGWAPPPLGPRDAVVRRLGEVLPALVLTSDTEGHYHGEDFILGFDLGPWELVPRVRLLVQGPSDEALDMLGRVAEALDARALDTGLGDFIRFRKDPLSGRHVWRDAPATESGWAPA